MKEKMRKVRYPMLIVWGIFMGAAGTAGVKSSWHVIPGWLIGVIVILGIMVMLTWMISGKNDKSIKTPCPQSINRDKFQHIYTVGN